MQNKFSGSSKKYVPQNLEECYKTDIITEELWDWAERIEKWGRILLFILVIIGIIDTVFSAINSPSKTVEIIVVSDILSWCLYIFAEYCVYRVVVLIISALATISKNTKIAANVALYTAAKSEPDDEEMDSTSNEDEWTCNSCGASNYKTNTRCKVCGASELFND